MNSERTDGMDDLVRRKDVIDALRSLVHRFEYAEDWCILEGEAEFVVSKLPSADVDLDKCSEKIWATAYQKGMRHGITTCGVCVHLHDNNCPMLCGRQLDDYCSWAEREELDETD